MATKSGGCDADLRPDPAAVPSERDDDQHAADAGHLLRRRTIGRQTSGVLAVPPGAKQEAMRRSLLLATRRRLCRARRGGTLTALLVALPVMVAVAGLTLDSGLLITRSANVKTAADATAYAASDRLLRRWFFDNGADPTGQARLAALRVAAANGYRDQVNSTVIVRVSPDNYYGGAAAGQPVPPGKVEV